MLTTYAFVFFSKDARLPVQLQRAMAAEAEAAREARAKVRTAYIYFSIAMVVELYNEAYILGSPILQSLSNFCLRLPSANACHDL